MDTLLTVQYWLEGGRLFLVPLLAGIAWFMYVLLANDRATSKLEEAKEDVHKTLEEHELKMYSIQGHEASPCEVHYTVIPSAKRGLPSRVFLRKIRSIKNGPHAAIHVRGLLVACQKKHEQYIRVVEDRVRV